MSSSGCPPLFLIPYPRVVQPRPGHCTLTPATIIRLLAGVNDSDRLAARQLAAELHALSSPTAQPCASPQPHATPQLRATPPPPGAADPDIRLTHEHLDFSASPEAYRLRITPERVTISAATAQGRFYGAQTLRQLIRQFGNCQTNGHTAGAILPALEIQDTPDLPQRGVMLDVSRGKVPTLATLKAQIELFASLKYNQLQLYVEHPFAFERHPLLGAGHSPLTPEDIMELAAHGREHHLALVPNLQSFGHVAHTLEHERYRPLAESDFRGGWTLSPAVPQTYDLLRELYAEYLPCFSHRPFFNVDCDETWDLGKGRSRELAAQAGGVGRVYLDHLLKVRELLQPYGCRMLFWGDIIEQHPELVAELPRDVVLLNWGYDGHGKEARYHEPARLARQAGLRHWVCPGTGAWLSFFFRKDNARDCLSQWAEVALNTGATGYLNTDWGDDGHLNCVSNSWWSFAYGAECAWCARAAEDAADFDERFMAVLLPGAPPRWRELLNLLGNQYQVFAPSNGRPNNIHRALLSGQFLPGENGQPRVRYFVGEWPLPGPDEMRAALDISRQGLQILDRDDPLPPALDLVRREWLAQTLLGAVACRRGLAFYHDPAAGAAAERWIELQRGLDLLQTAWHERNRPSDWARTRAIIETANRDGSM